MKKLLHIEKKNSLKTHLNQNKKSLKNLGILLILLESHQMMNRI
jgi:hypothetical protein